MYCAVSSDIPVLVKNVRKSKCNNIVICWKHTEIGNIIKKLTNAKVPKYDDAVYELTRLVDKETSFPTTTIKTSDLNIIKRSSEHFTKENDLCKFNVVKHNKYHAFAILWDFILDGKELTAYAGLGISPIVKDKTLFKVEKTDNDKKEIIKFKNDNSIPIDQWLVTNMMSISVKYS